MSPAGTAAARTARRKLATYIRDPEDDEPRTRGRTRAQTRSLARESSAIDDGGVEEAKMAVPSLDEGVIAAMGGEGAVKTRQSVTVCAELDKGMDEKVEKDLLAGTEEFFAMLADDRVSKHHAGLRRDGPIGMQRKNVEREPLTYKATCCAPNKGIWRTRCGASFRVSSTTTPLSPLLLLPDTGPSQPKVDLLIEDQPPG